MSRLRANRLSGKSRASSATLAAIAQAAGFTGPDLPIAVAVAQAESGGDPLATNHNANGSTDFGLFQVNSIHAAILASGDWRDPAANARMAFAVWQTSGWRAWTTYRTGAYLKFMAGCSAPPAGGPAASPLTPGSYTITSTFGPRWGTLHAGIDLAAPALTPIYAALPGVVVQASDTGNGYGQEVLIRTGNVDILYAHQSIGAIVVTVGQAVTAGQRIGGVGTTGDSTGNHCHFEIRVNGTPVDPVPFMAARGVRIA